MKKLFFIIVSLTFLAACSTKKAGITNRTYHRITSWYNTTFNGDQTLQQNLADKKASYKDNYSTILKVEPIDPFEPVDSTDTEGMTGANGLSTPTPRNVSSRGLSQNNTYAGADNYNNNRNQLADKLLNTSGFDNSSSNDPNNSAYSNFHDDTPPSGSMDRVMEKGNKAIDNHSILIKGKEYNSMLAEAYLMLGKASYYSNDPFQALNYLTYMNKTLVKNPLKNEAKNYIALANAKAGNVSEANLGFEELKNTKLNKHDRKLVSQSYAQFLIDQTRYQDAIEALDVTKKYNKTSYNVGRYSFIQGQLYEKLGDEDQARSYYQAAYKRKPSSELEIKSQIALANLFKGDSADYHNQIQFLKGLTRKGLYQSRKNELLYAMGVTALKSNREKEALNFFQKSLREQESDPQIRGLAYKSVGDVNFSESNYIYAGLYYDSALVSLVDPKIKSRLTAKNKNLKEITQKYFLIKKNDSILALTKMSSDEQNQYFQKYIDNLKIKEEKERKAQEDQRARENTTTFATETLDESVNSTATATKGKWYFYDTSQKQKGMADFKRLWGDRALADGWRFNKTGSISPEDQRNRLLETTSKQDPQRFDISFYTEKIPTDVSVIDTLKQQRDTAELALGIAYYEIFTNLKSSTSTLEHLLSTPPKSKDVEVKALYNLFRFNRKDNPTLSQKYGDMLTSQYPNSRYAEYVLNPTEDIFKSKSSQALTFYEEAYNKYENGQYDEVKAMAQQALTLFPTDELIAKFSLLSAFCEGKQGNKAAFLNGLELVSVAFEDKPEGKKAAELLDFFKEQQKAEGNPDNQTPAVNQAVVPEQTAQPIQTVQPQQTNRNIQRVEPVPPPDEGSEPQPPLPPNRSNNNPPPPPENNAVQTPENADLMLNPRASEILKRDRQQQKDEN